MSIKQAKRIRLSKLFGTTLVEPAYNTTASAKKMLDTEMEYISYLRNRKKFFFMTQLQQTQVTVARNKAKEKRKGNRFKLPPLGLLRRLKRKFFDKKKKNNRWKGRGKGNKVGQFFRNTRAWGLKKGRQLKYSKVGRLVRGGADNVRKAGKFVGELPGRAWRGAKNLVGQGWQGTKNLAKKGWDKTAGVRKRAGDFVEGRKKAVVSGAKKLWQRGADAVGGIKTGLSKSWDSVAEQWVKRRKQIGKIAGNLNPKKFLTAIVDSPLARRLIKVGAKGTGRAVPIASSALAANDIERYRRMGGWKGKVGMLLAGMDLSGDAATLATSPAAISGVGASVPAIAQVVSQIGGWGLTIFELGQVLMGQDPYMGTDGKSKKGFIPGLADGGVVSSPTQALIAEGGEPELVIPNSKLGAVYQSLLKQVGSLITGVTGGFLQSLPVPSSASQAVMGEVSRIENIFGIKSERPAAFKGSKLTKIIASFAKKATRLMGSMPGPMGMISALGRVMFGAPANAGTLTGTASSMNIASTDSKSRVETLGTTSTTQVSGFPITDYYGPSDWRPRPHGGVDVGTPVGTGVAFAEPGEILAAGKFGGYGNLMDVWLPSQKIQMRIAHLSRFIKKSGQFSAGEVLAKTGGAPGDPGAGSSTGPHLHFEFSNERNSVNYGGSGNPLPYAHLIQLGNSKQSTVEAGGPSLGVSMGHPLSSTVKWPSSGGSMGGPSSGWSKSKAKGMPLQPTPKAGTSITKKVAIIPMPIPLTIPVRVPVPIMKTTKEKRVHGVHAFSGRFGEL